MNEKSEANVIWGSVSSAGKTFHLSGVQLLAVAERNEQSFIELEAQSERKGVCGNMRAGRDSMAGPNTSFIAKRTVENLGMHWQKDYEAVEVAGEKQVQTYGTLKAWLKVGPMQEKVPLKIIDLEGFDVLLGIGWLRRHNPRIDWAQGSVAWGNPMCTLSFSFR